MQVQGLAGCHVELENFEVEFNLLNRFVASNCLKFGDVLLHIKHVPANRNQTSSDTDVFGTFVKRFSIC